LLLLLLLYDVTVMFCNSHESSSDRIQCLLCLPSASLWFLPCLIILNWRWRRQVAPKYRLIFNGVQCIMLSRVGCFTRLITSRCQGCSDYLLCIHSYTPYNCYHLTMSLDFCLWFDAYTSAAISRLLSLSSDTLAGSPIPDLQSPIFNVSPNAGLHYVGVYRTA
jgi:hypothetical protein